MMATILDKIVASKRTELEESRNRFPIHELESQLAAAPPVRDFRAALEQTGERAGLGDALRLRGRRPG